MSSLDRILSHAEEFLLGVLLATASLVLFVNVVARYVFNWGFPWAEELVRYEIVWMVFLGGVRLHVKGSTSASILWSNSPHVLCASPRKH